MTDAHDAWCERFGGANECTCSDRVGGSTMPVDIRCNRCYALLGDSDVWDGMHVRSEHAPDCDGTETRCMESCPVPVQCGVIVWTLPGWTPPVPKAEEVPF